MGVATAAALTGLAWPRPWQQQSCSSHWERIWSPQHPGGERGKESKVRVPMRILGMGQGNQGNTLRLLYKTSVTPGPHRQASHGLPSSQVYISKLSQNILNELMTAFSRMVLPLGWCLGGSLKVVIQGSPVCLQWFYTTVAKHRGSRLTTLLSWCDTMKRRPRYLKQDDFSTFQFTCLLMSSEGN